MWSQVYDPLHNIVLSALLAAVPVVVLLGALGVFHLKAHFAALLGLVSSLLISTFEFGMPVQKSLMAAVFGVAYGLQLGLNPVLMAAANSSGGVMAK